MLFYLFPPATLREVDRERFRGAKPMNIGSYREVKPLYKSFPLPLIEGEGDTGDRVT